MSHMHNNAHNVPIIKFGFKSSHNVPNELLNVTPVKTPM